LREKLEAYETSERKQQEEFAIRIKEMKMMNTVLIAWNP
jgi:hypothetical protein